MITKNGLTIKHNVRAMMYFERATEKNFLIKDQFDIVSYMYISARLNNDSYNQTLDEFADQLEQDDIMHFCEEIQDYSLEVTPKKKEQSILHRIVNKFKELTTSKQ